MSPNGDTRLSSATYTGTGTITMDATKCNDAIYLCVSVLTSGTTFTDGNLKNNYRCKNIEEQLSCGIGKCAYLFANTNNGIPLRNNTSLIMYLISYCDYSDFSLGHALYLYPFQILASQAFQSYQLPVIQS